MLKPILTYLAASLIVVLFAKYARLIMVYINLFYTYLDYKLAPIFSDNGLGFIVHKVILLVLIPILIVAIPALIYRPVTGKTMPHFIAITWCAWLVIVLSNVLIK